MAEKLTLDNVCGGAVPEVFRRSLDIVLKNIRDPNTDAEMKRKLTLDFEFTPHADRSGADVVLTVKEKLASLVRVKGAMFVSQKGGELAAYLGRRTFYVHCQLPEVRGFPFGQFMDHEAFIIGLQAHFTPTEDRDYLVRLASSLSTERVRTSEDDGVSQTVALRAGVVLKGDASTSVRARVTLAPFRTFREIEQPASEFIFRLRNAGESQPPTLALFEGDGGKWRLTAMETISRYLRVKLEDLTVVV